MSLTRRPGVRPRMSETLSGLGTRGGSGRLRQNPPRRMRARPTGGFLRWVSHLRPNRSMMAAADCMTACSCTRNRATGGPAKWTRPLPARHCFCLWFIVVFRGRAVFHGRIVFRGRAVRSAKAGSHTLGRRYTTANS